MNYYLPFLSISILVLSFPDFVSFSKSISFVTDVTSFWKLYKVFLKNLDKSYNINETRYFKFLKGKYVDRVQVFNKNEHQGLIKIICSLTPKTPNFFLSDLKPNKIGLFFQKKVITTDYYSPFLIMKNTEWNS